MQTSPTPIEGATRLVPELHQDVRGTFAEWYRPDVLRAATGRDFPPALGGLSVSARGVTRGIHFADVPPGQAKYITCVRGAVFDVVVDLRVGSPTYGTWHGVELNDRTRHAVLLAEGLGHGFCALTEEATVLYLCSEPYAPAREHVVHPLDPGLAIAWPEPAPLLSPRDAAAPTLAEARAAGVLASYAACQRWAEEQRDGSPHGARTPRMPERSGAQRAEGS